MRPWENAWQNWTLLPGGDVVATVESGRKFVRLPADGGAASEPRRFDGGTDLTVGPDPEFESWHHHTAAGSRMIGLPGGGVAIWLPSD